ncbi:hypothetical protein [uncultured Cohaesibacter sp.]|uniref:hypothetical protein n=1 Tax=uncultured Cohaesibacter sp. TaxID=1002546 RepID=UPI003749FEFE
MSTFSVPGMLDGRFYCLCPTLRLLPVHTIVVDSREDELLQCEIDVEQRCTPAA